MEKKNNTNHKRQSAAVDVIEYEKRLIKRITSVDEDAFETLFQRYYPRLYRFILSMTGNIDGIEEIINDTMYVVWQKASSYNDQCKPNTWIFGIAFNKTRKHTANARKLPRYLEEIDQEKHVGIDPDDSWFKKLEFKNWLEVSLQVLSYQQRAVIELTYQHGMHYKEIAQIMKCPENTIKTRMFHARKKLALALNRTK